jgi:hypothetical protein
VSGVSDDDIHRVIGRLEAQVAALTSSLAAVTALLDRNNLKLSEIEQTLSAARGGYRVLMLVGGAAGTIGSLMTYLASAFIGKPGP